LLDVAEIKELLAGGRYELSRHALRRIVERNLSSDMIEQAGGSAELIEDYPDDKYAPSCLLLGYTREGMPLHLQVCRGATRTVKIITLYVPDPAKWSDDYRTRRAQS
jgi:hypothetical protein